MVWFQVCDTFWSHHKVIDLPPSAGWLWVRAGAYCSQHLTDGFVTNGVVKMLGGTDDDATALVFAGLWKSVRGGYRFHDWEKYQQSRQDVLEKRAAETERKRKYRTGKVKERLSSPNVGPTGTDTGRDAGRDKSKPNLTNTYKEQSFAERSTNDTTMLTAEAASDFDKFWKVYPRRMGKQAARKAFQREAKSTDPAEIIAGAQRFADDPNLPEKTFIPHPATWLNRAGWLDEPYPQREAKPGEAPTPQPPKFDRAAVINPEAVPPPTNLHEILRGNTA